MPYTTTELVAAITEVEEGDDLAPWIAYADELVTECCTGANGPAVSYSDQRLELIATWLTAHLYRLSKPEAETETADAVSQTIRWRKGYNLDQTQYGQHAKMLDTNGGLSSLDERIENGTPAKVGAFWLGKDCDTEAGYL